MTCDEVVQGMAELFLDCEHEKLFAFDFQELSHVNRHPDLFHLVLKTYVVVPPLNNVLEVRLAPQRKI